MVLFWVLATFLILTALLFVAWPCLPWLKTAEVELVQPNKFIVILLIVLLPCFAIVCYLHWGSSTQWLAYLEQQHNKQAVTKALQLLGSPDQVIERLKTQLQDHPDAKGWYLLGKLYLSQEQVPEAINAFAKANQLKPNDPQIMLALAEAQYLAQHRLTPESKQLIDKVLIQQPENIEANNILAIAAYQQGNYEQAIERWEQLLNRFPAESEDGQKLLQAIAKAQTALKTSPRAAKIHIPLTVTLTKDAKANAQPSDTVFIYAQAAQGPKMPLAIIRKQVRDLPVKVTLAETMTMVPELSLAKFKQVRIVARISKSGQAMPQPGDWMGETKVFSLERIPANLHISVDQPVD
jgi:cytochrome c-type biogenesis protein CcmH